MIELLERINRHLEFLMDCAIEYSDVRASTRKLIGEIQSVIDKPKSNSETEKLRPCPFCGGEAELRQEDFDPRWMPTRNDPDSGGCPPYYVKCNDCGANTEYRYAYPDAKKLWNRRA